VDVAGGYDASGGPATSVNVYFYASSGALPGAPVLTQTEILPSSGLDTGNFSLALSPAVILPAGHYWVSVQANKDLDPNGQWFWRDRRNESNNMLHGATRVAASDAQAV
jgi:hypothetical protein